MQAEAEARTGPLEEGSALRAALNALSQDVEELQADIERLCHEAAVIQCGNPRVLQVGASCLGWHQSLPSARRRSSDRSSIRGHLDRFASTEELSAHAGWMCAPLGWTAYHG